MPPSNVSNKVSNPARWPAPLPPLHLGRQVAVPVDIERLQASVRFDVASRLATAAARVELTVEGGGLPVFDLRQDVRSARWDGAALAPTALAPRDIGAGEGATVRVVEVPCAAGSRHTLELDYQLRAPESPGAVPVHWKEEGVGWDFWMSDLEPGRYLEMWFPANLCHDRFAFELEVEVVGARRPHVLIANGAVEQSRPGTSWTVHFPPTFTSLSPLLVLAPADEVQVAIGSTAIGGAPLQIEVASFPEASCDLANVLADCAAWLGYFSARYGRWAHGERFLAVMWGLPRGMEYDGATTACEAALEHEIFHSWFGRGVKPARPCDGWIDEAMATWATASRRSGNARYSDQELGLDEPPVLLCPPHPWSRYTPREAYPGGGRLLAGVAHLMGGAPRLRAALADWHQMLAGSGATTEDLAAHLGRWCGRDLSPWWDRYVYGQG